MKRIGTTCISLCAAVALVNTIADPYGQFWETTEREAAAYSVAHPRRVVMPAEAALVTTSSRVVILGSSRVLRGFDTCNSDEVLKVGIGSMSDALLTHLVQIAMKNRAISLILIEATPATNVRQSAQSTPPQLPLSFAMLTESIAQLADRIGDNQSTAFDCREIFPAQGAFAGTSRRDRHLYSQYRHALHFSRAIADSIDRLHALSSRTNARLVFFLGPVHPGLASPVDLDRLAQSVDQLRTTHHSQLVNTSNWFELAELSQSENWLDANHFSHRLGNRVLERLVSEKPYTNVDLVHN